MTRTSGWPWPWTVTSTTRRRETGVLLASRSITRPAFFLRALSGSRDPLAFGGGKYLAVLQFRKLSERDEGRQRQAALTAFAAFPELKHVILVDDDVNIYDTSDVLWAMTTRYQGDASTVFIPGVRCHPLDPSQSPDFSPSIPAQGVSCKTIFDCTVPYRLRDRFRRPVFQAVDLLRFTASQ